MGRRLVFNPTGACGTWTVKLMIKSVVTKIRKIDSYLSQKFHSMFVTVRAEARFLTYVVIDFIFESLDRSGIFDVTV